MSKIFFAQVFYISPDLEEHIFTTIYTANERLLSVSGGCCSIFARNSLFDGTIALNIYLVRQSQATLMERRRCLHHWQRR